MQINAFVPASYVELQDQVVSALSVPQVTIHMPPLAPNQGHQATAQILLCISTLNGQDHDPHFYIKVHDGDGVVRGTVEQLFIWEDVPHGPMKWRVFDLRLPFLVFGAGVYQFGVYAGADDPQDHALSSFLVPVILDAPGQLPFGGELQPPNQ